MAVISKTFLSISLEQGLNLALMDKNAMYFNMMAFQFVSDLFRYNFGKKLEISEENLQSLLEPTSKNYDDFIINDRRLHTERINYRHCIKKSSRRPEAKPIKQYDQYPVIPVYNDEMKETQLIPVLSHYTHQDYTSDIRYRFNPDFIALNNKFKKGWRKVSMDVMAQLTSRYSRWFFVYFSGKKCDFSFNEETLRREWSLNEADLYPGKEDAKNKYRNCASLYLILEQVKKDFKKLDIEFDYFYGSDSEYKTYKATRHFQPEPDGETAPAPTKKRKKRNASFWFEVKGIEQYRIPQAEQSRFERITSESTELRAVLDYMAKEFGLSPGHLISLSDDIVRLLEYSGYEKLMKSLEEKRKQFNTQRKPIRAKQAVITSLIHKGVAEIRRNGSIKNGSNSDPQILHVLIDEMGFKVDERLGKPPNDTT